MSKNGEAARAIGIAMADSTFNGILFGLLAFALLPFYAPIIYKFGVPELFMFMTLSIACVAFIVSKNFWLSCCAIGIGAFIGLMGIDPQTGGPRLTFGTLYLQDGVPIIMMIADCLAYQNLYQDFILERTGLPR